MSPRTQGDRLLIAALGGWGWARRGDPRTNFACPGASDMSNSAFPTAAPRRRFWPLFLVFGLVVALIVAWTGLWFYVAAQAQSEIATWRERERQAGRQQDCASLSVSGYPFRIEVRCDGASFELEGMPAIKLDLPSALAVVQIYNPKLLISEFTSPL